LPRWPNAFHSPRPRRSDRNRWKQSEVIQERGGKQYKGVLADDKSSFKDVYQKIKNSESDFVIQEYIPGSDNSIYSFHAYFNRGAHPVAYFVGRKIRNFPKEYGHSTYLELIRDEEVVRLGIDILKRINYVGLVKIDFKQDIRTKQFYILEINPRSTLWNYLGAVSGINLPLLAYRDIIGEPGEIPKDYRTDIRWLSFPEDVKGFLQEFHQRDSIGFWEWILSYWHRKVYSVFAWQDPIPFVVACWFHGQSMLRRLKKRFMP